MSNSTTNPDSLSMDEFDKPSLPGGLNVLTILTFIGSAFQIIGTIFGFVRAQKTFEEKDKMMAQLNSAQMPKWAKAFMPNMDNYEELVTKSFENKWPIFILGLLSFAFCLYGAIQMRKLVKQGFLFYVIGSLLPFVSSILFIGFFAFSGFGFAFGTGITLLFILLYALNRKHLIH
jgi:hypothetical protein